LIYRNDFDLIFKLRLKVDRKSFYQACSADYMCIKGVGLKCSESLCLCDPGFNWNEESCGK